MNSFAHAAWEKRGLAFCANGQHSWMATHAAVPFARRIDGDVYEVMFSCRDGDGRSHVGSAVIDIERPHRLLDLSSKPLLVPGELGEFDDSGAMLSWICPTDVAGVNYWYYIGWNLGRTVPFRNSIGLALEDAGGIRRAFPGPIVDRSRDEPHFVASCCVIREPGRWRMYYLSCTGWTGSGSCDAVTHRYHIKYAESDNGIDWRRPGIVAIDFGDADEYAISRPTVLGDPGRGYRMWYSHRGAAYRIGYAESADGVAWVRRDADACIDPSPSGWDSEMLCYPHVVLHDDHELMFYNGNGYGRTGFGLAVRPAR